MAPNRPLPFKVGEEAESKSFLKGFRSAWFRCKINKISHSKDSVKALLEFYDYPGEKMHWTKLYQRPIRAMEEERPQLILRPCFPPWYRENQMPDPCTISDLIVIVDDVWKVGDLVDWWSDDCFWSGIITNLLGKDKVQVLLPDPPVGEGKSYEAFCGDLRPSLNWSLEHGWTVPESETSRCCARLVQPLRKGKGGNGSCTVASNTTDVGENKNCTAASDTTDNERDTCKLEEYGGGCASCDTWTSVSSSARAGSLLSPSRRYIDPHVTIVNKKSKRSSERENNKREAEVQSPKVCLDSDDGRKVIANNLCVVVSSSLVPQSGYINTGVNSSTHKGKEETEDGTEVQSTHRDLTLDDGVTTNCWGQASSTHASSSSLQVGHMTPESGSKTERETEIQSTNMIMDSENSGREITDGFDKSPITATSALLPSTGYTSPEIYGRTTQVPGRENTEEEVQSSRMDLGSGCDRRGDTSRLHMASSTLAPLFLSLEVNDISRPGSGEEETEWNREMQSTALGLKSDDSRRKITNSVEISGQTPGREEVEATDVRMNPGAPTKITISRLNQDLGTSSAPLCPVRCLTPEIGETSMQSSGVEETEQTAVVHPTGMNVDTCAVEKQITGRVGKLPLSSGASLFPSGCHKPEINDTLTFGTVKTERNGDAHMLDINLDSDDGIKLTNLLDEFSPFRKRSRITGTCQTASVTAENSIESSILDLEELANKIKWLKRFIIYGLRPPTMKPSWKFSEP